MPVFYRPYQQYGTGVAQYTDIAECVVALLQAGGGSWRQRRGYLRYALAVPLEWKQFQ